MIKRRTLDRLLSRAGAASRTEVRRMVRSGRITVNSAVEHNPLRWVDPSVDRIAVDGVPIREQVRTYLALHKPKGYITTRHDPEGRATVFDLLPDEYRSLVAIGRLDRDTTGLLLLTNDTDFANGITNPKNNVPRTYVVKVSTFLSDSDLERLRSGVLLKDGLARAVGVRRLRNPGGKTVVELTIHEGRNREVRRMIEALGSKVVSLARTAIGDLGLGDLKPGAFRELTDFEVSNLKSPKPQKEPGR